MRFTLFLAAFLSLVVMAAPRAHAEEDMLNEKRDSAPKAAPADAGGGEFDSPPPNAAYLEEKDPDKPPPLDEYNEIPTNLMIPAQQVAAAGEAGSSGIMSGSGKLTYENLMKMYQQGKYTEVAKDLEPLAKGGHKGAQELMGIMYRQGQGVAKDSKRAYDFLAESAAANRPLAQYHLATMYYSGDGVQSDPIMALMWLQIAIVHYPEGPEKQQALTSRDNMYTHLTRREKDRALQMAREWLTKKGEAHLLDLEGL
ncbi:MAG: sel1 repeat family protein [Alphaproteobacteria bacterium]|nr:MAG: sel1 repeat family protein [Alphaproteobacteria bacterium]